MIRDWTAEVDAALAAFSVDERYAAAMSRRARLILRRRARAAAMVEAKREAKQPGTGRLGKIIGYKIGTNEFT